MGARTPDTGRTNGHQGQAHTDRYRPRPARRRPGGAGGLRVVTLVNLRHPLAEVMDVDGTLPVRCPARPGWPYRRTVRGDVQRPVLPVHPCPAARHRRRRARRCPADQLPAALFILATRPGDLHRIPRLRRLPRPRSHRRWYTRSRWLYQGASARFAQLLDAVAGTSKRACLARCAAARAALDPATVAAIRAQVRADFDRARGRLTARYAPLLTFAGPAPPTRTDTGGPAAAS